MSHNLSGNADWRFRPVDNPASAWTTVRIRGRMVADNGEQAHDWALAGLGLVRRSIWDVTTELGDGRLVEVLPEWTGESSPIQVVYTSRRFLPTRTRQFIDLLVSQFSSQPEP
jgi:DNA-binding transcriptional LysR family regulator